MTQGLETKEIYIHQETREQLTYDTLTPTDKWLAFRVRASMVDDIVTADPDGINLQACFEVVDQELSALRDEARESLGRLDESMARAFTKKIDESNAWNDYTERDIHNLQKRYEDCELQGELLRLMQEDREGLEHHTEKLASIVRQSAYDEAIAILQQKADEALKARLGLEGQNAAFLQENISLQEQVATLEDRIEQLRAEVEGRDRQLWDREFGDSYLEVDSLA